MDETWDMIMDILLLGTLTGMVVEMVMSMLIKMVPQLEEVQKASAPLNTLSNMQTAGTLVQTLMREVLAV